jgi:hypothetical protein
MPFGLKNATNTFSWTMVDIFKDWINKFLKVFIHDVNIHDPLTMHLACPSKVGRGQLQTQSW